MADRDSSPARPLRPLRPSGDGDSSPVLPARPSDEYDEGWGDPEPSADDDVRRLTEDVPPHHVDRS